MATRLTTKTPIKESVQAPDGTILMVTEDGTEIQVKPNGESKVLKGSLIEVEIPD